MPATNSKTGLAPAVHQTNDYHELPATEKQIGYARVLAQRSGVALPRNVLANRKSLSTWIDERRSETDCSGFSDYPSSKQVAFAERIARHKRRQVPHECFRSRALMSRWIDSNR